MNSRIVEVRLFESGWQQLPPESQNKFDSKYTLRTVLVLKYTFDSESTLQATFTKFLTLEILGLGVCVVTQFVFGFNKSLNVAFFYVQ